MLSLHFASRVSTKRLSISRTKFRSFTSESKTQDPQPTKNLALIFPGQGTQFVGMGKDLLKFKEAERIFKIGEEILGKELIDLMFNGPFEKLTETKYAQPAILLHSMAILEVMKPKLKKVEENIGYMFGHSLGEFSALCATESISLENALKTVSIRGQVMGECIPVSESAMVAMMPAKLEVLNDVMEQAHTRTGKLIQIANINSQSQVVLSGHVEAIDEAIKVVGELGLRMRTIKLTVGGPFHTTLMEPAIKPLHAQLSSVGLKNPKVPIISNVTAREVINADSISSLLIKQVCSPVQWYESVKYASDHGVTTFIEMGPGRVLTTLIRQIDPKLRCIPVGSIEDIEYFSL